MKDHVTFYEIENHGSLFKVTYKTDIRYFEFCKINSFSTFIDNGKEKIIISTKKYDYNIEFEIRKFLIMYTDAKESHHNTNKKPKMLNE